MPNMGDPRFHRAVILICAHDDNGAMGLQINQPLPGLNFPQMLDQLNIHGPESNHSGVSDILVLGGGPVENTRGFLLHDYKFRHNETIPVTDDIAVTGTIDALRDVAVGKGPKKMVFVLGYSGWTAGQLDQEIQENVWLVMDADRDVVFTVPVEDKWTYGIRALGVDLAMLSGEAGRA